MKTTIEVPDELFRKAKAAAATRGMTLGRFIAEAMGARLTKNGREAGGWRSVFGKAPRGSTREVDELIKKEFETIDPADWA
ncbi:MAG: hypothetical protein AAB368_05345 [bacterium]